MSLAVAATGDVFVPANLVGEGEAWRGFTGARLEEDERGAWRNLACAPWPRLGDRDAVSASKAPLRYVVSMLARVAWKHVPRGALGSVALPVSRGTRYLHAILTLQLGE